MVKEKTVSLNLLSVRTLTIILSALSFLIPFCFGKPQFLIGSIINSTIIFSALYLPGNLALPIIILPSLAVLSRGIIFGPFSIFLIYFLPIIWLANFSFYLFIKKTYQEKHWSYLTSLIFAGLFKTLLLFSFSLTLYNFKIIPAVFLTTMGWIQLLTAISGGLIIFFLKKINLKNG